MAIYYTGNITYTKGHETSKVPVNHPISLEELESFAVKLVGLTNCATAQVSFIVGSTLDGYPETPGAAVEDIALKARIQMKQTPVEPDVYPFREMPIPSPKADILEFVDGQGYRVKQTVGEQVAAAYSEVTGKTYEFQHGWLSGGD